jgi:hypothetical protein
VTRRLIGRIGSLPLFKVVFGRSVRRFSRANSFQFVFNLGLDFQSRGLLIVIVSSGKVTGSILSFNKSKWMYLNCCCAWQGE